MAAAQSRGEAYCLKQFSRCHFQRAGCGRSRAANGPIDCSPVGRLQSPSPELSRSKTPSLVTRRFIFRRKI